MSSTTNIKELEIAKLHSEYLGLKIELEELQLLSARKVRSRIIGVFTGSGALTEKLLIYIIKKEGRESQLTALGNKGGIFEYKRIVENIIPKQQNIHIGTIIQWRNLVSHANDIDKVDLNELRAVSSALQSLIEWFFRDYLKEGDLLNRSFSEPINDNTSKSHDNRKVDDNLFNIPDFSILSQSKKFSTKKRRIPLVLYVSVVFLCLALVAIKYAATEEKEQVSSTRVTSKMNKEEAFTFIVNYFNSFNDKNNDPYVFFANKIDRFYDYSNLNPTQVEVRRQMSDYIDNKHRIDKESFAQYSEVAGTTYWRFWNDYTCYRPSLKKYQICKVLMEFGINTERKIISIQEIKVLGLKFQKRKPV